MRSQCADSLRIEQFVDGEIASPTCKEIMAAIGHVRFLCYPAENEQEQVCASLE